MRFSERFKNFSFSPSSCQRSGTPKNTVRVTVKIFGLKRETQNEREKKKRYETRTARKLFVFVVCCSRAKRRDVYNKRR